MPLPLLARRLLARLFGVDLRALALFRVGLGALILADLACRASDLAAHYSGLGVLPLDTPAWAFESPLHWSLHRLWEAPQAQATLFALNACAAAALALGWRTRISVFACWLLHVSLYNRNPLVNHGADTLLRLLLFWSLFLPLGEESSLDAARREGPRGQSRALSVASAALLL